MVKTLKYVSFIQEIKDCPPSNAKEINSNIYRYTFEDRNHEHNFKPVLLIKPLRINSKPFDVDEMRCSGYALSVYNTLINAVDAFIKQNKRNKNFKKIVGECVAAISVTSGDGLATQSSTSGHLDFFEYVQTDLSAKIIKIEKVIE